MSLMMVSNDSPLVRMVSLTGDVATGQKILQAASRTLKRTHLELGGKAPVLVFDDADVAQVVERVDYVESRGLRSQRDANPNVLADRDDLVRGCRVENLLGQQPMGRWQLRPTSPDAKPVGLRRADHGVESVLGIHVSV